MITPVGIGTAPMGSDPSWRHDWDPQDPAQAIEAIHAALDLGVNWIDTAPFYGWGRSEELIGQALPGRRDEVLLFTKCGVYRRAGGDSHFDLRPGSLRLEVEGILKRLRVEHLDLLPVWIIRERRLPRRWRVLTLRGLLVGNSPCL